MICLAEASKTNVYPEDGQLLDTDEAKKAHRDKLKDAMQMAQTRYRMEWLQQLNTDESAHLISVCRRKMLAMMDLPRQMEELDKSL